MAPQKILCGRRPAIARPGYIYTDLVSGQVVTCATRQLQHPTDPTTDPGEPRQPPSPFPCQSREHHSPHQRSRHGRRREGCPRGRTSRGRGRRRGRRENRRGGRPAAAVADPGPPGPVGVRAARRGVGVLPAGVPRHGLQRAWGLEAIRPLRGVQVHRCHRPAGFRLHDAAAPPARRPPHRRPGPGAQDRPPRRLRRGSGDRLPDDVGAVSCDPDHQPHARGR